MNSNKIILLVVIILDLLLGLLCMAIGIWFNASKDIVAYMTLFVTKNNTSLLAASAGILLAIGCLLPLLAIFGLLAVLRENLHRYFNMFLLGSGLIFIMGMVCGWIPVGVKYDIHVHVKSEMRNQLKNLYSWDSYYGKAWNRVQVKKKCCGIDGAWDYKDTKWFGSSNDGLLQESTYVPDSCCVLNFNQERELYWVDPQQLQLKDAQRCQEDAWGNVQKSANVQTKGCFAALFTVNPDLWHDQSIWTVIDCLNGLGLTVGFYQLVVVLVGFLFGRFLDEGKNGIPLKH